MAYHGDILIGDTIDFQFCTVQSTGAPTTLAGSPVLSARIDNDATQITAGITLSVDFDGVTGYNNVRVVATAANGYTPGTNVSVYISTGTVNSVSAVGYVVGSFSIMNRYQPGLKGRGTAAGGGASSITLASGAGAALGVKAGDFIVCVIDGIVDGNTVASIATDTCTMDGAWGAGVAPDSNDPYWVYSGASGITTAGIAAAVLAASLGAQLGSLTLEQYFTKIGARIMGNNSGLTSGAGTLVDKDWAGTDAVSQVISADGNRSSLDLTP